MTIILAFATYDRDGSDADGSGGILACTAEVSGMRVGPATLVRNGKEVGSLMVEKLNPGLRFLLARCSPTTKGHVGDEIVQHEAGGQPS